MNCLIADDETPAREHLRALLRDHPQVEVAAEADSGAGALQLAREHRVDLAFLDVEMPPPKGLEVARALMDLPDPPAVVFLTGHSEHALEAYDIGAMDYLLKPVRRDRLARTLERLQDRREEAVARAMRHLVKPLDRVLVTHPVTQDQEVVSLAEVSWFTAEGDQVFAHVRGGPHKVGLSLARLEARLHEHEFVRTHKAWLVNLRKVVRLVGWSRRSHSLVMDCGTEVPLSRHYLDNFRARVPGL